MDQRNKQLLQQKKKHEKCWHEALQSVRANVIPWIEKLLQTPLWDYRKFSVWRILSPYVMNVKNQSYNNATYIIKDWLDRCSELRRLDFSPSYYVRYNLNMASRKGYLPISANRLKNENKKLYDILRMP